jgi:hypothetical protein
MCKTSTPRKWFTCDPGLRGKMQGPPSITTKNNGEGYSYSQISEKQPIDNKVIPASGTI